MYWGPGREGRYSGARRGIGSIRGIEDLLGSRGCWGLLGASGGVTGCKGCIGGW